MKRPLLAVLAALLLVSYGAPVAGSQEHKTVVLGFAREPGPLVAFDGGLYESQVAANLVYSRLVGVTDRMDSFPDLAAEIPTVENGGAIFVGEGADRHLETTFVLRPGVTWSDGSAFTARDVVWTWNLSLNGAAGLPAGIEKLYSDVVAVDDSTVVFKLLSENEAKARDVANGTHEFDTQSGPVLHPHYSFGLDCCVVYPAAALDPLVDFDPRNSPRAGDLYSSSYARQPVGTGPYSVVQWSANGQIIFDARSDYFRGRPAVDRVVIRTMNVPKSTLLANLAAGTVQTLGPELLDVGDLDAAVANRDIRAYVRVGTTIEQLAFNTDNGALGEKAVRQAIAYAVDREQIANELFAGRTRVALNPAIPQVSPFYNANVFSYGFDPARAQQLLDEAGWSRGSDGIRAKAGRYLRFSVLSTGAETRLKGLRIVQNQLRAVGIELNIQTVEERFMFAREGSLRQGTFDMAEFAIVGSSDAGLDLAATFAQSRIPTPANGYAPGNFSRWRNPVADSLIEGQAHLLGFDERRALLDAAQLILTDELPSLPLYYRPNVTAATSKLTNFRPPYSSIAYTWNAWEWDLQ